MGPHLCVDKPYGLLKGSSSGLRIPPNENEPSATIEDDT